MTTLSEALTAATGSREFRDAARQASNEVSNSTLAEFGAFLKAERARWAELVKATGVKKD